MTPLAGCGAARADHSASRARGMDPWSGCTFEANVLSEVAVHDSKTMRQRALLGVPGRQETG